MPIKLTSSINIVSYSPTLLIKSFSVIFQQSFISVYEIIYLEWPKINSKFAFQRISAVTQIFATVWFGKNSLIPFHSNPFFFLFSDVTARLMMPGKETKHSAREISVNMGVEGPESDDWKPLLTKITQLQDIIGADEKIFRLDICKLDKKGWIFT